MKCLHKDSRDKLLNYCLLLSFALNMLFVQVEANPFCIDSGL